MATRFTTEDAIARFISIHGDRYDYSRVEYVNTSTPVVIGCRVHGWFRMSPNSHISQRQNCPRCGRKSAARHHQWDTATFVEMAMQVHGDVYDYSLVQYINSQSKISIGCMTHGVFWQRPAEHVRGKGCSACARASLRMRISDFVERATELNGDRYDYSGVFLTLSDDKVLIGCRVHGEFYQAAIEHLRGKQCPACANENQTIVCKSHGEEAIAKFLDALGVAYQRQKTFLDCRYFRPLPFDFYFEHNGFHFLIEYDGEQHYRPVERWGGEQEYRLRVEKDTIKTSYAISNGYTLIRVPYSVGDSVDEYLRCQIAQ